MKCSDSERKEIFEFCEEYKIFLKTSKTEEELDATDMSGCYYFAAAAVDLSDNEYEKEIEFRGIQI